MAGQVSARHDVTSQLGTQGNTKILIKWRVQLYKWLIMSGTKSLVSVHSPPAGGGFWAGLCACRPVSCGEDCRPARFTRPSLLRSSAGQGIRCYCRPLCECVHLIPTPHHLTSFTRLPQGNTRRPASLRPCVLAEAIARAHARHRGWRTLI